MLTTTPRFRPREGCDPRPTTSMRPSCVISPTIATTFDVPMSSPTMRLRSFFLGMLVHLLQPSRASSCEPRAEVFNRRAAPSDESRITNHHSLFQDSPVMSLSPSRATRVGAFQPTEKPLL